MSGLEQRCILFSEAATGAGKTKGDMKEIATLRKFLHKNQEQRFTDKASGRLIDTIQIYATKKNQDPPYKESQEGLLEDALMMPFTVFTTKQKKRMLRWLEDLRGETETKSENAKQVLSVIDLSEGRMCLMDDQTGDTFEDVEVPPGELEEDIEKAYESTDSTIQVIVHSNSTSSSPSVIRLVGK